jgi:hypothetical protein
VTAPNTYADLEIRILEKQEHGYPVEITFNGEQEFPRGFLDPGAQPRIDRALPQESGVRLFQWLFAASELQAAWAQARGQHPLRRIRLRIDATVPELHAIPWELLRDAVNGSAPQDLAAMEATPFSRYLAGQWIPGSPILKRPIRILVAIANPTNLPDFGLTPVDSDHEWKLLHEAVAGNCNAELVRLPDPCTLQAIEAALRKGVHILHFVGHGQFIKEKGQAVLYLPDEKNYVAPAKDADIGAMLGRQLMDAAVQSDDKLRLVYLSSCQTAVRSPADAFRGLAPQLVSSGVPAVLAMQDLVPVVTAHEFSRTFYRELLDHGEADRASNAARSSLLTAGIRGAAIPVLFMRLRFGQLFGNRGMILGPRAESFWSTLLENIADRECTPFLGPAVTTDLLPRPEELAHELASKFSYPFPDHANLPHVTQFIGTIDNRRLRKQVLSVLIAQFRKRMGLPLDGARGAQTLSQAIEQAGWSTLSLQLFESEIHHQLAALGLPLYITTNFDNFMTLALRARAANGNVRRETVSWRNPARDRHDLDPPPAPENPVVMHLFGTDDDLLSMVLTEDDHLDYLARISHDHDYFLPASVNERLAATTLLFLGYRLEDLDLKVILRGLLTHLDLERWGMLHVAVQVESARRDQATEKEVIDYFQKYFAESRIDIYWGSAQQFMADLSARCQEYSRG